MAVQFRAGDKGANVLPLGKEGADVMVRHRVGFFFLRRFARELHGFTELYRFALDKPL